MQIKFLVIITLSIIPLISYGQQPDAGRLNDASRDRIEAQRIGFITQKLSLTPEEASKFWPIYNQHKNAVKELRDDIERPDLVNISDDDASVIVERHLQMEENKLALKRDLFKRLRPVIGPRKILMLHAAEREFNKQLLNRWTGNHPGAKMHKDKSAKEKQ